MTQLSLPVTEENRKRAILERMEDNELRAYLLQRCRKYARGLYRERKRKGHEDLSVCADDVRDYLEHVLDPPDYLSRNFLGQTFRKPWWRAVGWTKSTWPGSHSNPLRRWKLDEAEYDGRAA